MKREEFDGDQSSPGWRRRWALHKVKPGTGKPLKPFRWWQMLNRSLFYLRMTDEDGRPVEYAVDVKHSGNSETGLVEAQLYLDGRHNALSTTPAIFPVPGGDIEVKVSSFGMKRVHYVADDGTEQQLIPDSSSAEGRRASFDRTHPGLSRGLGVVTLIALVLGLVILAPQLVEQISKIPPIADKIGTFTSPFQLSVLENTVVTIVTILASTERALRLRFNWLLDGSAG